MEMCYLKSQNKFYLNLLDSNTTNIVKDMFIIPTEDRYRNSTWL